MLKHNSNTLLVILLAFCLVIGCTTQSSAKRTSEILAFVDVTVVSMNTEHVTTDQTVIVRDGRIDEIGPASQITVPKDAMVIEGRGKYLMPGLADMHVHLDTDTPGMLVVFLANGVTTVRNMWGTPDILAWRQQVEEGELLGPTIYTTGPILDGDPPAFPGSTVITTPEQAEKEVEAEKKAGYDAVKVLDNLSPEVYAAILSAARERDLPVYGHVPWRVGMESALGGGHRSFEHMTDWMHALLPKDSPARRTLLAIEAGEQPMNFEDYMVKPFQSVDKARIPELVARAAAADVWFCPTLVVSRRFISTPAELEALRSTNTMKFVAPSYRASWDGLVAAVTAQQPDSTALRAGFNTMLASVAALNEAGVGLLVGTDTQNPFVVPGFAVHEELQNFVDAGLTPYEAMRAATRDAADFLGASEEFGTVAVGRRADLILVEANPLEDVRNVARRVGVSIRGRWFSEQDLLALLDDLAQKYTEEKREPEATPSEEGHAGAMPDSSDAKNK